MDKKKKTKITPWKVVRGMSAAVDNIVFIMILLAIVVALYTFWDTRQMIDDASYKQYIAYKPGDETNLSYKELTKLNPEVIGWIEIYGTTVDYPMTQAKDNTKYLNTDPLGEYNLLGAIFLDYRNNKNFTDFGSVLYGHHMSPSAMFGDVGQFKKKKFFDKHKYGNIYYNGKDHGLVFFAFFKDDGYRSEMYHVEAAKTYSTHYLNYIKSKAISYREIDIGENDHIVTCSTCSNLDTNERYLLVAKITDQTYKNTFDHGDKFDWGTWFARNKFKVVIIAIIILILLVLLIRYIRERRKEMKRQEADVDGVQKGRKQRR